MPHVEMDVETALPPERVRAALLDFSERRPEIWSGIDPAAYRVYFVHDTEAEIREGTKLPFGRVWARERYDWSREDTIRWTVMESNFSAVGSYVEATLTPRDGGGTRVHVVWDREGSNVLGKILVGLVAASKGKPVAASIKRALGQLEKSG